MDHLPLPIPQYMDPKALPSTAHLEGEGFCKHLAGYGFHSDNCHTERNPIILSMKAHLKHCASLGSRSFLGFCLLQITLQHPVWYRHFNQNVYFYCVGFSQPGLIHDPPQLQQSPLRLH